MGLAETEERSITGMSDAADLTRDLLRAYQSLVEQTLSFCGNGRGELRATAEFKTETVHICKETAISTQSFNDSQKSGEVNGPFTKTSLAAFISSLLPGRRSCLDGAWSMMTQNKHLTSSPHQSDWHLFISGYDCCQDLR